MRMPLPTAPLAMTRRGRIVPCGDRLGTRQYQLGKTFIIPRLRDAERMVEFDGYR